MYAYKGEAFISKQKNGYKILNKIVVIPWNSCTVMYMYEENLLPVSHVQTFEQNVHVQAFEAKIVCCTTTTKTELLLAHSYNLVNQESKFFPAKRFSHNDYSIFTNINLYINIVQIMNIGYWCYWKQYQKLVVNSPTDDWM